MDKHPLSYGLFFQPETNIVEAHAEMQPHVGGSWVTGWASLFPSTVRAHVGHVPRAAVVENMGDFGTTM